MSSDLFDIENSVISVAGAAGAFGSCISKELIHRGCRLSIFDKDEAKLKELADHLPVDRVHLTAFDARNEEDCKSAFRYSADKWGKIDGFINCVGLFEIVPATQITQATFSEVIETNVNAGFLLCRSVSKWMIPKQFGRIINIASVSDSVANPGYAAYASSKAALTHLTRILALEWAQHSITVNAVSPAICETDLTSSFLSQGDNRQNAISKIPMNRLFDPTDILGTVILLLSPAGSFITGQSIHIDGGRTIF